MPKKLQGLNSKIILMKTKYGWTPANFADYFHCSEDEFMDCLQRTFKGHLQNYMLSSLKQNQKRRRKSAYSANIVRNRKKQNSTSEFKHFP